MSRVVRGLQEVIEVLSGSDSQGSLLQKSGTWDQRAIHDVRNACQLVASVLRLREPGRGWRVVNERDATGVDVERLRHFVVPTRAPRRVALVSAPATRTVGSWINYRWPMAGELVQRVVGVSAAAPSPDRAALAFPTAGAMSLDGRWTVPK